jgi:CLIP-associating protein 1/2
LQGKETEQNWLEREKGVICVRGMLKGGVHRQFVGTFMAVMKDWFAHDSAKVVSFRVGERWNRVSR